MTKKAVTQTIEQPEQAIETEQVETELVAVVEAEPVVAETEVVQPEVEAPVAEQPTGEQPAVVEPIETEQVKVAEPVDDRLTVLEAEKHIKVNEMLIKSASRAGEITGAEKTKHGWRYTEAGLDAWAQARKAQREAVMVANGVKAKRYTIRVTDEQLEQVTQVLKELGIELK